MQSPIVMLLLLERTFFEDPLTPRLSQAGAVLQQHRQSHRPRAQPLPLRKVGRWDGILLPSMSALGLLFM